MSALAPLLLEHVALAAREELAAEARLEPRLAELVADAQAAWPAVAVPHDVFLAAVAAGLAEPTILALEGVHGGDVWLACAALRGDVRAVQAIEQCLGRISPALRAVGLAPHELDEVMQQLRTHLLVADGERHAKLARYAGRGPLEHWLRIVAVRHAREWRGSRARRDQLLETFTSAVQARATDDPELALVREKYGALFREVLAVAIEALDAEDRELVRHVVEGGSPADLGEALGVHRTTAMRRVDRARLAIRDTLKRELVKRLAIDRSAADSLLRLYDTGFQLPLGALLVDA